MTILQQKLYNLKDDQQAVNLSRFFKTGSGQYGEGDKFLGIKVPITRKVADELWDITSFEDLHTCLLSDYHEVRLAALLVLVKKYKNRKQSIEEKQRIINFYLAHTQYINNWDLVDLSCYKILGDWLLDKDRSVLYELAKNGKTIWEQRIGIVSTMAFVRKGQTNDTYKIADILLHHEHDLIQKSVGWLLRKTIKVDSEGLDNYLKTRHKTMPRTMLRYAIEKYPEEQRKLWLAK